MERIGEMVDRADMVNVRRHSRHSGDKGDREYRIYDKMEGVCITFGHEYMTLHGITWHNVTYNMT
jgi:hypothetical protein